MSFPIYLIGFLILTLGLAMGAHMLHVSTNWIAIGVVVMIGLGLMAAVSRTRQRDPSA